MKYIAQIDQDGFCFAVGTFPADYVPEENEMDVTDNPRVAGKYYRDGQWTAAAEPTLNPTQLDRIEESLHQLAAGSVSEETLNAAIAEGVNAV